jgi:hypothetical protein
MSNDNNNKKAASDAMRKVVDDYINAGADGHDLVFFLRAAFAVADQTDEHEILLQLVYNYLCARFGHESVRRGFAEKATPAASKKERALELISHYIFSGKSQEAFAQWAAQYNKEHQRPQRLGTQTINEKAMLRALKRALHQYPEFAADLRRDKISKSCPSHVNLKFAA